MLVPEFANIPRHLVTMSFSTTLGMHQLSGHGLHAAVNLCITCLDIATDIYQYSTWANLYSLLCRFFPDGQFVYRTSPDVIRNTVRSLQLSPGKTKADPQVEKGIWRLNVSLVLKQLMCVFLSWSSHSKQRLQLSCR